MLINHVLHKLISHLLVDLRICLIQCWKAIFYRYFQKFWSLKEDILTNKTVQLIYYTFFYKWTKLIETKKLHFLPLQCDYSAHSQDNNSHHQALGKCWINTKVVFHMLHKIQILTISLFFKCNTISLCTH